MDKVLLKDNIIIHKNKIYNYDDISNLKKILKNKVRFTIANNLVVDICKNEKGLNKDIIEDLTLDEDILFHDILDKKLNERYIYTIRGGNLLVELIDKVETIDVKPVQFVMKKITKRYMIKKREYRAIIKFLQKVYIIDIKNDKIINSQIITHGEFIAESNRFIKDNVVLDIDLKNEVNRKDVKYINIKRNIERLVYGI